MSDITSLSARCTHCGELVTTPFSRVTVRYDREERSFDRLEWMHDDCGLNVRNYDGKPRDVLADYVGGPQGIHARFIDGEFRDPGRYTDLPAITEADCREFARRLNTLGAQ